jgi:hypothetical protein
MTTEIRGARPGLTQSVTVTVCGESDTCEMSLSAQKVTVTV